MGKTLIVGDLHLGGGTSLGKPGIGAVLNSRIIDQLDLLEWIFDYANDNLVSNIILTGDIVEDPKIASNIIALFISWLKKCSEHNMIIHIVMGNHDTYRSGNFYISPLDIISAAEIDNVFIHNEITSIHTNGSSFTLMPFRDRRSLNVESNSEAIQIIQSRLSYELAEIDRNNLKVNIGHFALEGSIPALNEIEDTRNEIFLPLSTFDRYDFTTHGHIHKPQMLSKNIGHIGSLDLSDFGEANHTKILTLIDVENQDYFKHIEIPSRPLKQISVSVPENIVKSTDFVLEQISKETILPRSILKLNVSYEDRNAISMDRKIIEKSLFDKGVFHISRISEERKAAPIKKKSEVDNFDNTISEMTAIHAYARVNVKDELQNDFISLANSIVKELSEEVK